MHHQSPRFFGVNPSVCLFQDRVCIGSSDAEGADACGSAPTPKSMDWFKGKSKPETIDFFPWKYWVFL